MMMTIKDDDGNDENRNDNDDDGGGGKFMMSYQSWISGLYACTLQYRRLEKTFRSDPFSN